MYLELVLCYQSKTERCSIKLIIRNRINLLILLITKDLIENIDDILKNWVAKFVASQRMLGKNKIKTT